MPAMPMRSWKLCSSRSALRISATPIMAAAVLPGSQDPLALEPALRHEEQPGEDRPQERAGERADQDRPSRNARAGGEANQGDHALRDDQQRGDVQRLQ